MSGPQAAGSSPLYLAVPPDSAGRGVVERVRGAVGAGMGVLVHQRRVKRTPDVEAAAEIGTSVRPDVTVAARRLVLGDGVRPTIARIPAIHDAGGGQAA